ncbi:META domain-containing protein [Cellulomonas sp. NPDC057328]|uniref:META domain-containing protein n=1 Tax=Cellulomonas sp. NPDC057328 TaxID=3346101 RepID=UPI0036303919
MRDDERTDGPAADDVAEGATAEAPDGVAPDGVADGDATWLHGTWRVTEVDGEALEDGIEGPPWLTFEGDGQVYGYAGVNHVRGTWRVTDGRLDLGPVVQTMMAGPPGPTATEQAVTAVLADGGAVRADGDDVEVRTPAGRVARLVRSAAPAEPEPDPQDGPHVLG